MVEVENRATKIYWYEGRDYENLDEVAKCIFEKFVSELINQKEKRRWEEDGCSSFCTPNSIKLVDGLLYLFKSKQLDKLREILDEYDDFMYDLKINDKK